MEVTKKLKYSGGSIKQLTGLCIMKYIFVTNMSANVAKERQRKRER